MVCQLAVCHPTDGMDEVPAVQVFKPILIQVMSIGAMIEVMSRGVLDSVFVVGILEMVKTHGTTSMRKLTRYSSSLNIKGVMAQLALVQLPA